MARAAAPSGVRYPVLVPNQQGFERAMAADPTSLRSSSPLPRALPSRTWGQPSMARSRWLHRSSRRPVSAGFRCVAMCPCALVTLGKRNRPWTSADVAARLVELGCSTISLGDTIGVATAGLVVAVLDRVEAARYSKDRIALHLRHLWAELWRTYWPVWRQESPSSTPRLADSVVAYAKSATGNLATEDLVWMLAGRGIDLVSTTSLVQTSRWLASELGRPSPSRVVAAWRPLGNALLSRNWCRARRSEGSADVRHRRLRPRPEYRSGVGWSSRAG